MNYFNNRTIAQPFLIADGGDALEVMSGLQPDFKGVTKAVSKAALQFLLVPLFALAFAVRECGESEIFLARQAEIDIRAFCRNSLWSDFNIKALFDKATFDTPFLQQAIEVIAKPVKQQRTGKAGDDGLR